MGVYFDLALNWALVAAVSLVESVAGIRVQISVSLEMLKVENVSSLQLTDSNKFYPRIASPLDLFLHSICQSSN
jgi:hypothetical protein